MTATELQQRACPAPTAAQVVDAAAALAAHVHDFRNHHSGRSPEDMEGWFRAQLQEQLARQHGDFT